MHLREKFIELQDGGAVLPDGVPGAPAFRVGVKETLDLLFRQAEGRPATAACLPRRRGFIPRPGDCAPISHLSFLFRINIPHTTPARFARRDGLWEQKRPAAHLEGAKGRTGRKAAKNSTFAADLFMPKS